MSRLTLLITFIFIITFSHHTIITTYADDPTTETPTTTTPTTATPTDTTTTTSPPTATTSTTTTATPTTTTPTITPTATTGNNTNTNGTTGNTTVAPTASPTTTPTTVSTRATCYDNSDFDRVLKETNDVPPWTCPRLDVDGGALGESNNYDPCFNLTKKISLQLDDMKYPTDDMKFYYYCSAQPISGLNSSREFCEKKDSAGGCIVRLYRVPTQITKGDPYQVAIVTSNILFNKKMMFQPVVDSFTSLEIAASHGMQWFSVPNTYIALEAGGMTSGPRQRVFRVPRLNRNLNTEGTINNYKDKWPSTSDNYYAIVPFWTVLINVDNGVIKGITWDEGCDACADQLCSPDNNCGVDEYACAIVNGTNTRRAGDTGQLPEYDIRTLSPCASAAADYFRRPNRTQVNWKNEYDNYHENVMQPCIDAHQITSSSQDQANATSLTLLQSRQTRVDQKIAKTDCSVKIYLGWTGTDKDGKFFTSAGRRLSVFRKYSIGAAYNSASTYAENTVLPDAPTNPDTGNFGS